MLVPTGLFVSASEILTSGVGFTSGWILCDSEHCRQERALPIQTGVVYFRIEESVDIDMVAFGT